MAPAHKATLSAAFAGQCLVAAFAAAGPVSAAGIPDYFFREWTVTKNCTEAQAGLAAKVASGLRFRISRDSAKADGSYVFQAEDSSSQHWAANWNGLRLEFRPGTQMTSVPADFECIPGQESSSPFLAMSGYAQATEPYYEQQHWYGLARIHGQLEHVLIFPRNVTGASSAIIVLASVTAPSTVQLDDDGVIHSSD